MNSTVFSLFLICFLIANTTWGQKGNKHHLRHHHATGKVVLRPHSGARHRHVVVVKRIPPPWAPKMVLKRRWLYYPKYNFYYDCIHVKYIYLQNSVWVRANTLPPAIIQINLNNEKHIELDDDDTVENPEYNNSAHVISD
jgi:hypothetical protein